MGRSRFLVILLVSTLPFLSFRQGFGRVLIDTVEHEHSTARAEGNAKNSRVMIEVMDYGDPEPNTSPKNGFVFSPSSPPLA